MLDPNRSGPAAPAPAINRPLVAADLQRTAEAVVAVLLPIVMPDLGMAGKLLGLTPAKAGLLLQSDLGPKIASALARALALPDHELALIADGIALRIAAWRMVRPASEPSPELAAAIAQLRAALT